MHDTVTVNSVGNTVQLSPPIQLEGLIRLFYMDNEPRMLSSKALNQAFISVA